VASSPAKDLVANSTSAGATRTRGANDQEAAPVAADAFFRRAKGKSGGQAHNRGPKPIRKRGQDD